MNAQTEGAARCNRATPARTPNPSARISRTHSIAQKKRRSKYQRRRLALLLVLVALIGGVTYAIATRETVEQPAASAASTAKAALSQAPAATATPQPTATTPALRYALSEYQRDIVERVVMAEAGGESYEGQMLVAQCILNAAEKTGTEPSEVVVEYKYAGGRPEPTQSVRDAVAAVFDDGEIVTDEPIMFFYNPARVTSKWHESQTFVIEVGGHRFFSERSK